MTTEYICSEGVQPNIVDIDLNGNKVGSIKFVDNKWNWKNRF